MPEIPQSILERINRGQEMRTVSQPMEARVENENEMLVEGYACTFNDEYELYSYGDYTVVERIDPHAFDQCDMSDVIMQFDHAGRVFARTRNKTLELTVDGHGLKDAARLGGNELGRSVYADIKGGYLDRQSFRFRVDEDKREIIEDHQTGHVTVKRTITKIGKLYDVSVVSIPANDATEISARSAGDGVIDWARQELEAAEKRSRQREQFLFRLKLSEVM